MTKLDLSKAPFRTDGRVIVSYPKSGRTWIRFALTENNIEAVFTHAGYGTRKKELGITFNGVQDDLKDIPVVFLHRNPIDTAVSMYYQVTRRDFRRGSSRYIRRYILMKFKGAIPPLDIDAFVLDPLYGVKKICQFNRAWLDHLEGRSDCLVMTYEELRNDPAAGFQRLLDYFGETKVSGEELATMSSFERMKMAETTAKSFRFIRPADKNDPQSAKIRKGKVHGYREELRPETIQRCREIAVRYGF